VFSDTATAGPVGLLHGLKPRERARPSKTSNVGYWQSPIPFAARFVSHLSIHQQSRGLALEEVARCTAVVVSSRGSGAAPEQSQT